MTESSPCPSTEAWDALIFAAEVARSRPTENAKGLDLVATTKISDSKAERDEDVMDERQDSHALKVDKGPLQRTKTCAPLQAEVIFLFGSSGPDPKPAAAAFRLVDPEVTTEVKTPGSDSGALASCSPTALRGAAVGSSAVGLTGSSAAGSTGAAGVGSPVGFVWTSSTRGLAREPSLRVVHDPVLGPLFSRVDLLCSLGKSKNVHNQLSSGFCTIKGVLAQAADARRKSVQPGSVYMPCASVYMPCASVYMPCASVYMPCADALSMFVSIYNSLPFNSRAHRVASCNLFTILSWLRDRHHAFFLPFSACLEALLGILWRLHKA